MNYSQTLGALKGQEFLQKLDETEKESKGLLCVKETPLDTVLKLFM